MNDPVTAVIIGGPRNGQGLTVDRHTLRAGVILLETPVASPWGGGPTEEVPTRRYRWERYAPVSGRVMNLLVRDTIPLTSVHEHLDAIFTPAARAAMES